MDLATKEKFKWKFYRLAVLLNIIILLVGVNTGKPGNGWTIRSKWSINEQTVLQVRGNNDRKSEE